MKKTKIILSLAFVCFLFISAGAQKISIKSGDLSFLKGISVLNVEFDYSENSVGKFKTEQAYIDKKKKEYNDDEAGKGDTWEEEWNSAKGNTYQPKFEQNFNLMMLGKDADISISENPGAEYTMIFKTTFMEPGYNIGISSKNSSINAVILFVKTDDPSEVVGMITMDKVPGYGIFGPDFDAEYRISEAYANAGRDLGSFLWKKVLK